MSAVIPDPFEPEKRGIAPDGHMVFGVKVVRLRLDRPPTLAELEEGTFLGWFDGFNLTSPE